MVVLAIVVVVGLGVGVGVALPAAAPGVNVRRHAASIPAYLRNYAGTLS